MDVSAADGATLHAELDGQESAPVTLVLAHGWTLDATTWGPVVRSQALQGVRVLRYDHRGHGRSAPADPSTMTLEQLADDLAAVIGRLAPDGPLVLGGHSMGGMTIMALAQRHPEVAARAQGIALVATAAGGLAGHTLGLQPRIAAVAASGERRLYASRRWGARPTMGSPRLLAPGVRWLLLGRGADPQARRLTVDAVAGCRPQTAAGFRPTLDAHDRVAALAAFAQTPTVVLAGTRDRLTPVPMARRIVEALPSAQLTVFPRGRAHAPGGAGGGRGGAARRARARKRRPDRPGGAASAAPGGSPRGHARQGSPVAPRRRPS